MRKFYKGAHGALSLGFGLPGFRHFVVVHGGPYAKCPKGVFGVSLRELHYDDLARVRLPIPDFGVPVSIGATREAVRAVLRAIILEDQDIYVGCMGGFGRTGLFLALLVKVSGSGWVPDPVAYVREYYHPHAVETAAQTQFVATFPVLGLRWYANWLCLRRAFTGR